MIRLIDYVGGEDDKPPSRVQFLVGCYNPVVCYPIAPINAYRVLFWHKTDKERSDGTRGSNCLNYV